MKTWSDANPGHVPIMIDVEMKDAAVTPATFDALEAEIRSVFPPADLVTPDDVRGADPSLGHAVSTRGWPTLGAVRGRVMFMLDNENFAAVELQGHPSLRGRILFTSSSAGSRRRRGRQAQRPDRRRHEDQGRARGQHARSHARRRRHRAGTRERHADARRRARGGAQFVSTDYEVPDTRFGPYVVKIPGGTPARCNPVTAPPGCRSTDIENPDVLAETAP